MSTGFYVVVWNGRVQVRVRVTDTGRLLIHIGYSRIWQEKGHIVAQTRQVQLGKGKGYQLRSMCLIRIRHSHSWQGKATSWRRRARCTWGRARFTTIHAVKRGRALSESGTAAVGGQRAITAVVSICHKLQSDSCAAQQLALI